jgi:hypothetical protein
MLYSSPYNHIPAFRFTGVRNVGLSRILTLLRTYPMPDRILFLNDIHGINNIPGAFVMDSTRSIRYFVDSLTRATVNAWRICRMRPLGVGVTLIATMRLDWDVLQSVARDTANRTLKNVLWIRNLDRYDKLLSNYRGSCNTCRTDSTSSRLPRLSRYLDTVVAFAMRYGVPPNKRAGFDSFMTQEGSARGVDKPDGAAHLMRDLASPAYASTVVSFEDRISNKMPGATGFICQGCKYDVELQGNILVDYKSVLSATVDTDQFNQYLQYWLPNAGNPTDSILVPQRSFQYVFNGNKLDSTAARQSFYNAFKKDPIRYFDINPAFFRRFRSRSNPTQPVDRTTVTTFVNSITNQHRIFNFVIVKL